MAPIMSDADVDAEAAIVAHETRVESKAQAKRFTVYKVQVNLNNMRWAVYRRYSDFYALHQKVSRAAEKPRGAREQGWGERAGVVKAWWGWLRAG